MNNEEILTGNKLIAEFMGCYGDTIYAGNEPVYRYGFKDTHITDRWNENSFTERTPYHSSWDWLMPAIEKIEMLGHKCYTDTDDCLIDMNKNTVTIINSCKDNGKIIAVYKSVIQFIQWYNQQPK